MSASKRLCASPLSDVERARLIGLLDALCGFLGSPGDWGYGTQLGDYTIRSIEMRAEVCAATSTAELGGGA